MAKLTRDAQQSLRAVEDCLAHYSLDTDNMHGAMEGLRELVDGDKVFLYSLGQRETGDDLMITREVSVAPGAGPWRETFDEYVRGRGVTWGAYNAIRPEPAQRDCVLRSDELAVLTQGKSTEIERDLHTRMGLLGHDTMRVLVCDGPSLLAWVGIVQPAPTTEQQRGLLERVVPAFRRRLQFERLVAQSAVADAALVLALEEIPGAAWVVGPNTKIGHANAAGRARFDGDRDGVRTSLLACIQAPADNPDRRFKVARVRDAAGGVAHIVIETPAPASSTDIVWDTVKRLGLTPAQTRVFEHVARGSSNAAIAAELGVAERTVEAHVTAILLKAQVPSRAALIVQIFKGQRATSASA